jgi:hypothetical protein
LGEMSGVNEQDLFDEAAYLRLHPDVAKAIALGHKPARGSITTSMAAVKAARSTISMPNIILARTLQWPRRSPLAAPLPRSSIIGISVVRAVSGAILMRFAGEKWWMSDARAGLVSQTSGTATRPATIVVNRSPDRSMIVV